MKIFNAKSGFGRDCNHEYNPALLVCKNRDMLASTILRDVRSMRSQIFAETRRQLHPWRQPIAAQVASLSAKMQQTLEEFDAQLLAAEQVLALLHTRHEGPRRDGVDIQSPDIDCPLEAAAIPWLAESGSDHEVFNGGGEETEPLTDLSEGPMLSSGACRVLALVKKGQAYLVRGQWRLRGFGGCIREPTLQLWLGRGLAERAETHPYAQIRITEAGRSVERVSKFSATPSASRGIAELGGKAKGRSDRKAGTR